MPEPLRLLHVHPSFGTGGAQMRDVQIINGLGSQFHHTIVALDGDIRAAEGIADQGVVVDFPKCAKTNNPIRGIARIGVVMDACKPDLVLTYNWGSMDAVMAARLRRLPVIHTEDGFGQEEASSQKQRRVLFRRAVLRGVKAVVAPSQTLISLMRDRWKLPLPIIRYIPNGVDVSRFRPGEPADTESGRNLIIGTVGQLRPEKRQDLLIEACARLPVSIGARLILAGSGPEGERLKNRAQALGIADRIEFLGRVNETERIYPRFDIFALSSSTEQMPMSVIEAMACGLPILSTDVGDVKSMVSEANREFIVAWPEYQNAIERLAADGGLRRRVGAENRARVTKVYSLSRMLGEYEQLYCTIAERPRPALQCAS